MEIKIMISAAFGTCIGFFAVYLTDRIIKELKHKRTQRRIKKIMGCGFDHIKIPQNPSIFDVLCAMEDYMLRKTQINCTLHNMSKKREEAIKNGTWKPKPRKPLNRMSKKTGRRIQEYRERAFAIWGKRCFICGREARPNELDVHHPFLRANGDEIVFPLHKAGCGCGAHRHNGNDEALLEINKVIYNKLVMQGQAKAFNAECKRIHGVDFPTYYNQTKKRWNH